MENIVNDTPNLAKPETVPVKEASQGLDAIAAKMAAMRNQNRATNETGTGSTAEAKAGAPVAPQGVEVLDNENSDTNLNEPEIVDPESQYDESTEEAVAPEDDSIQVSEAEAEPSDVIDFLEFAEMHPNAKFKFMRNGKEIEVDAKKAAAILGQGAAISEEARQLKIQKAEFEEYSNSKKAETEGLILAMQFTIQPQIQKAYDEIIKVQGYQNVFNEQLAQTRDPAQQARIRANMQQNERYMQTLSQQVQSLQPRIQEFYDLRKNQVNEVLENNRKGFKDKELRNKAIYEEVREKIADGWEGSKNQLVPGINNIDLISADEHVLSLLRDGLRYRNRPQAKQAGNSIAALTSRRAGTQISSDKAQDEMSSLRKQARGGDMKAADNLLMAQMKALRAGRR
jgi:ribosomal protein S16